MPVIELLPEFAAAIAHLPQAKPWTLPIRPNVAQLGTGTQLIDDTDAGEALVAQLNRLPIGAIAIDTEFRFAGAPVDLGHGRLWQDPTTPASASSTALRVSASASPSSNASAATVTRWRAPFGRPGLPVAKGRPRVFAALLRKSFVRASGSSPAFEHYYCEFKSASTASRGEITLLASMKYTRRDATTISESDQYPHRRLLADAEPARSGAAQLLLA